MSSAPSSQISSAAAPAARFEIGFAEDTDAQAQELHRFLCVISAPALLAPINAADSMNGVLDVLRDGFAVTARLNGHLIGSLGIVRVSFWYNHDAKFMTDRWLFAYPDFHHAGVGTGMIAEAQAIAYRAGIPLVINGHQKRRGNGIAFTHPQARGARETS